VEAVIASSVSELFAGVVLIVVSIVWIAQFGVKLKLGKEFALVMLLLPVFLVPVYLLSRLLKRYQAKVLGGISTVTSRMQECFSGVQVIKTFNQEEREDEQFRQINEKYFRKLRKALTADVFIHPMMELAAILMLCFLVLLCVKAEVTLGTLIALTFAVQAAYKPIKDLTKLNAHMQKAAAAAERVFETMDMHTALPVPVNPRPISGFHDRIVYHDVSFRYTARGETVLEHIDLEIPKGALVALVGQTGSGKSTVANLLARFYDPSEGSITIDGIDLKEFAPGDFRRQVGMVSQDTFLFNTTIAENIRYGRPEATDAEVEEAARLANVTEFVGQWPEGFQHLVGERGNLLSGGQKQRIAIARAILRNPPILILDEATSALDTVTEQLVQEALNNVMKDRTVLAIAHRLSTIKSADEIIVLEQGRILERGTHQQLLEQNGRYRQLNDMQFKEEHS
jgi:ABC-type multidrug transport system fused ATPase/permease subunit